MDVEVRKSFEKDLVKLRERAFLQRIKAVIEEVETADSLDSEWALAIHISSILQLEVVKFCHTSIKVFAQGDENLPMNPKLFYTVFMSL